VKRFERSGVIGWLDEPTRVSAAVSLTHGAGSNCDAPFLKAAAEALSDAGCAVLRYDLPFRQQGVNSLTAPQQARDREGIVQAASELRQLFPDVPLVLAGHSYGGRQSSMVAAQDSSIAQALLMLSYPLHPPRKRERAF